MCKPWRLSLPLCSCWPWTSKSPVNPHRAAAAALLSLWADTHRNVTTLANTSMSDVTAGVLPLTAGGNHLLWHHWLTCGQYCDILKGFHPQRAAIFCRPCIWDLTWCLKSDKLALELIWKKTVRRVLQNTVPTCHHCHGIFISTFIWFIISSSSFYTVNCLVLYCFLSYFELVYFPESNYKSTWLPWRPGLRCTPADMSRANQ